MPVYKIILGMHCNGYGWTESWFKEYSEGMALPAIMDLQQANLLPKRRAMLAPESSVEFISISQELVNGDSKTRYFNGTGLCAGHCDMPHTTVYTRCIPGGGVRGKSVFFRGQPDDCTMFGGKFQPTPPGAPPTEGIAEFVQAATVYLNYLQSNSYGWMRDNITAEGKILTYTTNPADNTIIVTTSAGFLPPFVAAAKPKYLKVRIAYKGKKLEINGTDIWQQTGADELTSVKPRALFPAPGDPGLITRYTPTLTTFVTGEWDIQKSGERRAGKALRRTPGRQSAQPLG